MAVTEMGTETVTGTVTAIGTARIAGPTHAVTTAVVAVARATQPTKLEEAVVTVRVPAAAVGEGEAGIREAVARSRCRFAVPGTPRRRRAPRLRLRTTDLVTSMTPSNRAQRLQTIGVHSTPQLPPRLQFRPRLQQRQLSATLATSATSAPLLRHRHQRYWHRHRHRHRQHLLLALISSQTPLWRLRGLRLEQWFLSQRARSARP